jgi:hypothetical protein
VGEDRRIARGESESSAGGAHVALVAGQVDLRITALHDFDVTAGDSHPRNYGEEQMVRQNEAT